MLFLIKFQSSTAFNLQLLRRSFSCFKMRLIFLKHKKFDGLSDIDDRDITLEEVTIYTRIKNLARVHSYLNLIQLILHKRISLAFSIFRVFLFQHIYFKKVYQNSRQPLDPSASIPFTYNKILL